MINLDTHILIFALTDQLTTRERRILMNHRWTISDIVLWEITILHKLGRIRFDLRDQSIAVELAKIHTWPISLQICLALGELDFKSDPADEIIAATSLAQGIPLLTRDRKILKSKIIPFAH